jgi:hypothetical protein
MYKIDVHHKSPFRNGVPGLEMAEYQRLPWESVDEHWRARIQFVEHHKAFHGSERAVTLSHVWYNVYYYGAQYPPEVQQLVARWEPDLDNLPVIEEKKDAVTVSATQCGGKASRSETNACIGNEPLIQDTDIPDVDLGDVSPKLLHLSRTAFIEEASSITDPVTSLYNCAQKSRLSIKFDEIRDLTKPTDSQVVLTAVLNGVRIASATGPNRKAAKHTAAIAALKHLIGLQKKQGIYQKPRWKPNVNRDEAVARDDLVDEKNKGEEKLPDWNIGSQMLKKMGWSGSGGLGKGESKGIETPIMASGNLGREGLGARSGDSQINRRIVEQELRQFVVNDDSKEITFSNDLTLDDRRIVHEVAQQLHLKHRSFDISGERYLIVSKDTRQSEIQARKDHLQNELGVGWDSHQRHKESDRPNQKHRWEEGTSRSDYNSAKVPRLSPGHKHAEQNWHDDRQRDNLYKSKDYYGYGR